MGFAATYGACQEPDTGSLKYPCAAVPAEGEDQAAGSRQAVPRLPSLAGHCLFRKPCCSRAFSSLEIGETRISNLKLVGVLNPTSPEIVPPRTTVQCED